MALTILRKDALWILKSDEHEDTVPTPASSPAPSLNRRASDRFREIAEQNGSHAVWLPQSGFLVTDDDTEEAKGFPYEEWRDQALREAGHQV